MKEDVTTPYTRALVVNFDVPDTVQTDVPCPHQKGQQHKISFQKVPSACSGRASMSTWKTDTSLLGFSCFHCHQLPFPVLWPNSALKPELAPAESASGLAPGFQSSTFITVKGEVYSLHLKPLIIPS